MTVGKLPKLPAKRPRPRGERSGEGPSVTNAPVEDAVAQAGKRWVRSSSSGAIAITSSRSKANNHALLAHRFKEAHAEDRELIIEFPTEDLYIKKRYALRDTLRRELGRMEFDLPADSFEWKALQAKRAQGRRAEQMTDMQADAFEYYIRDKSYEINRLLRGQPYDEAGRIHKFTKAEAREIKGYASALTRLIGSMPELPEGLLLYRGEVTDRPATRRRHRDAAFLSTSIKQTEAEAFIAEELFLGNYGSRMTKPSLTLKVYWVGKGVKGIYSPTFIDSVRMNMGKKGLMREGEVLIQKKTPQERLEDFDMRYRTPSGFEVKVEVIYLGS